MRRLDSTIVPLLLLLIAVFSLFSPVLSAEDPYHVLGVSRTADKSEIKKAYTKLARKWHPDKNSDDEAANMMAKINKAYKLLSDDSKRRRYDLLGEDGDDPLPSFRPPRQRNPRHRSSSPTDEISSIQFLDVLVPGSHTHPYLIYYYHDFCAKCHEWTERWEWLRKDFHKLGLGTASVQVIISTQATLFSRVQLNKIPKLGLLLSGAVHQYNGQELVLSEIKNFVDTLVPSAINEVSSSSSISSNVSRVKENKPVVLLVSARSSPSLSYKLIAFTLQNFCHFFFLSSSSSSLDLLAALGLERDSKQLLIYKEYESPDVVLESLESKEDVKTTIEENKLLLLPRISSNLLFDTVCPYGTHVRTCLILMSQGIFEYNDELTHSFRQLAVKWRSEDFGVSYIDAQIQATFLNKFKATSAEFPRKTCDSGYESRSVLILRRSIPSEAHYTWYHLYCGSEVDEFELRKIAMASQPQGRQLNLLANVDKLHDENLTWFSQLRAVLRRYWEKMLSIFFLPLPLLLISCYLFYVKDPPNNQLQQRGQQQQQHGGDRQQQQPDRVTQRRQQQQTAASEQEEQHPQNEEQPQQETEQQVQSKMQEKGQLPQQNREIKKRKPQQGKEQKQQNKMREEVHVEEKQSKVQKKGQPRQERDGQNEIQKEVVEERERGQSKMQGKGQPQMNQGESQKGQKMTEQQTDQELLPQGSTDEPVVETNEPTARLNENTAPRPLSQTAEHSYCSDED